MGPGPLFRMNQSEVNISPLFVVLAKFLKCHGQAAKTPGPFLKIIKTRTRAFLSFLFVRMYESRARWVNISPLFDVLAKFLKCHGQAAKTPGPYLKIIKATRGLPMWSPTIVLTLLDIA